MAVFRTHFEILRHQNSCMYWTSHVITSLIPMGCCILYSMWQKEREGPGNKAVVTMTTHLNDWVQWLFTI